MADKLPDANQRASLIDPQGRLTSEGWLFIMAIIRLLNDHEDRIAALEP